MDHLSEFVSLGRVRFTKNHILFTLLTEALKEEEKGSLTRDSVLATPQELSRQSGG